MFDSSFSFWKKVEILKLVVEIFVCILKQKATLRYNVWTNLFSKEFKIFPYLHTSFDFLGYTFRPRRCMDKQGRIHPKFLPAISNIAKKSIKREIRSRHIQLKNDESLEDLSKMINPILRGWQTLWSFLSFSTWAYLV